MQTPQFRYFPQLFRKVMIWRNFKHLRKLNLDGIITTMSTSAEKLVRSRINLMLDSDKKNNPFPIIVSPSAKQIIVSAIAAIIDDPSFYWNDVEFGDRRKRALYLIDEKLLEILKFIAKESPGGKITTFPLLHSLARILDDICPFEKHKKNIN